VDGEGPAVLTVNYSVASVQGRTANRNSLDHHREQTHSVSVSHSIMAERASTVARRCIRDSSDSCERDAMLWNRKHRRPKSLWGRDIGFLGSSPRNSPLEAFAKLAYIMPVTTESLGQAIRRFRLSADYKLREFANLIGISAAYLSDIEHDRRNPTEDVLRAIARMLSNRVPVSYDELQSLSTRLESDLQDMVRQHPEVGQLLREVRQSGRSPSDVIRELQEILRNRPQEE
jgi:transcriptional regulator with XRE-family HTH domain